MGWTGTTPEAFADKTEHKFDLALRKIGIDMFSRVVLRSPVDTGRFRGNWQVRIDKRADGTLKTPDKTGATRIMRITTALARAKFGQKITLTNNLPYAEPLENRSSKQAPHGMVGITITEFQPIAKKIGLELNQL